MAKNASTLLSLLAFTVLFALCLGFVAIRALGLGTFIVTGGSMEPAIHKGSLVLVQPAMPSEVKLGDVITFQHYDQTTTHRVIEIGRDAQGLTFKTKGDANVVADPEFKTFPAQVGIVRATVPAAGYLVASVQAYWRLALTLVAAVLFFGCAGALIFRKDQPAVAQMPVRRILRTPVPGAGAPVQRAERAWSVDADETWNAHLAWLARSQQRRTRVA